MISAAVGFQCPGCVSEGRRETRRLTRPYRVRNGARVAMSLLGFGALLAGAVWFGRGYAPSPGDSVAQPESPADYASDSFAGTPAADYASGEAGLVMPEAVAYEGWSKEEVANALLKVRQTLAAMYVDRQALVDHDPKAVVAGLAPSSQTQVAQLYQDPARFRAVPLISKKARLTEELPRVKGKVTVRAATDDQRHPLEVVTNYVVIYPFAVPDRGPGSRLAVSHVEFTWRVYHSAEVNPADQGLLYHGSTGYMYNIDCQESNNGFLAPPLGDSQTDPGTEQPEDPDRYFDPSQDLDINSSCASEVGAI